MKGSFGPARGNLTPLTIDALPESTRFVGTADQEPGVHAPLQWALSLRSSQMGHSYRHPCPPEWARLVGNGRLVAVPAVPTGDRL